MKMIFAFPRELRQHKTFFHFVKKWLIRACVLGHFGCSHFMGSSHRSTRGQPLEEHLGVSWNLQLASFQGEKKKSKCGNIITLNDSFTYIGTIKPLPVCLNRGYNSVTLISFARRRLPFVLNNEREMMPFGEICHCLLFPPLCTRLVDPFN